jgi:hypothetical protein
MIDHDLSHELHSLAAAVDEPVELIALRRRIAASSHRRAAVKIGFAGACVAALVGGLVVVQQDRSAPAASSPTQAQPAPLPACDEVLAVLRAPKSVTDATAAKDIPAKPDAGAGDVPNLGFKGIVTILTIDGAQLTFSSNDPADTSAATRAGTLDAKTAWVDGDTQLDTPPTLQLGDQVGLATMHGDDGLDHVLLIDVGPSDAPDIATASKDKPLSTDGGSTDPTGAPGPALPPGPTAKGPGTITAVDAASITVTLEVAPGQMSTIDIDPATTSFYAGNTACTPGVLPVGQKLGVAYHLDDAGNIVADAALLMP